MFLRVAREEFTLPLGEHWIEIEGELTRSRPTCVVQSIEERTPQVGGAFDEKRRTVSSVNCFRSTGGNTGSRRRLVSRRPSNQTAPRSPGAVNAPAGHARTHCPQKVHPDNRSVPFLG